MDKIVALALKQRIIVVVMLGLLVIAGIAAFINLNIEAYPDPVPPLVDVVTQNTGQSADEIERYITIPIEIQMAGIPNVTAIRTISLFGLSDVKIQFTGCPNCRHCRTAPCRRFRRIVRSARSIVIAWLVRPATPSLI
jgi:heavy metal efflux system protein